MTPRFSRRRASSVGIDVIILVGLERHGVTFVVDEARSSAIGAQCASCNTTVWKDARTDKILNESVPIDIPSFGSAYKDYYRDKVIRFLDSMPSCPVCQRSRFDRFITNVRPPRFSDGTVWYADGSHAAVIAPDEDVWWLDN